MRILILAVSAACSGSAASTDAPVQAGLSDVRMTITATRFTTNLLVQTDLDAGSAGVPAGIDVKVTARGTAMAATAVGSAFQATFPGAPVEDEPVTVAVSVGSAAAMATVTMPADFAIASKTGSPMAPPFTVTWSPTRADPMRWDAYGQATANHTCSVLGAAGAAQLTDTGMLELDQQLGVSNPMYCSLLVVLGRTRAGTVTGDAATGSTITASQSQPIYP